MRYTVTSQFIRHNFPRLSFAFLEYSIKESLGGRLAKKHINDFTILIPGRAGGSPKIMLLALNLNEHFINKESDTISLMSLTQSGSIFGTKFITP